MKIISFITKHIKVIVTVILILTISFYILIYSFRNNISYLFTSVVMDNQDTILFKCSEFGEKEKLQQILKELPKTDPEFYSIIKEITVYDESVSTDELIMITPVDEKQARCPGKFQFEIWFNGHPERDRLNNYLIDGKLHGFPVFLRNV